MKNPLSVAATVLQPIDSASIYERQGQFALEPLLEKKQKRQQAEGEFAGVMADIEKFSSERWEQDTEVVSKRVNQFMDTTAKAYESAYMEGRSMSVMERYQIQKELGEIQRIAKMSAEDKKVYDYWSKEIVKNPDKYDVEASLGLLNQMYRDRALGERSVDNFLVQRFDESEFLKRVKATTKSTSWETPRGGGSSLVADREAIERNLISEIQSDPVALQRFLALDEAGQQATLARWIQKKVDEVNTKRSSKSKDYQEPYSITTTSAPEELQGAFGSEARETLQIGATGTDIIYNGQKLVAHSIMRENNNKLMLIAYQPKLDVLSGRSTGEYIAVAIPLENVKGQVERIPKGRDILKDANKLPMSGVSGIQTTTTPQTSIGNNTWGNIYEEQRNK